MLVWSLSTTTVVIFENCLCILTLLWCHLSEKVPSLGCFPQSPRKHPFEFSHGGL